MILTRWFKRHMGLAIGIYWGGLGAGPVLFAPLFYGGMAAEKVLRIKPLISLRLSRYSNQ